ncbi:transglutaminase family protein [Albidovulum sediminicola]|uniref:Transglutaminase family protein n=1 Tax=Albidovulum sediminicola TaxID=2984331 RepID=A0ABT2Z378_9RHOB|nr:transglutaminase family protein [Defluviimonas sp. WL0075]MCV2865535.1 transglutaminase family protein [Defluviimonas sp. WL0075]
MRLKISHATRYRFDHPVRYGLQQLRKTPWDSDTQRVLSWDTQVAGGRKELSFRDHHGNMVELISFERDATELVVTCVGEVELADGNGVIGRHRGPTPLWLYARPSPRTRAGVGVKALLRQVEGEGTLARMHALMAAVEQAVVYEVGASDPGWDAEAALSAGRGVCQDQAHAFIACAREMGVPARYVSGYLMLDGRIEQEAMHAWAEAHVDGLGWVGFDVANAICPDDRYVRLAAGLDYADAAPVIGTRLGGQGESMDIQIQVSQQ